MNKKIITLAIFGAFMFSGVVYAQTPNNLPSAGIKPDSFFFFLDRFGESIQEFFTFNSEAKAKLQIKFAGERIAEINAIVEKKGPEAKGIDKAKTLLLGNVAHAAEIVKEEKASGKDVSRLAKEIDDEFDTQDQLLVQAFQDARKKLKKDRLALKKSLAEQTGDASLAASLEQQLSELESQDDKLKDVKDEIKESFRGEKDKIEEELDDEDRDIDEQEEVKEDEQEEIEEMEIEDEDEEEVEEIEEQEAPEEEELEEADEQNEQEEEVEEEGEQESSELNQQGKGNSDEERIAVEEEGVKQHASNKNQPNGATGTFTEKSEDSNQGVE